MAAAELQRAAESTELSLAETIRPCCCSGQIFLWHRGRGKNRRKVPKVRLEKKTLLLSSPDSVSPRAVWEVNAVRDFSVRLRL